MNQSFEIGNRSFVPDHKSAKILQPCIGTFNDPAIAVASQFPSVLVRGIAVVAACRDNWVDTSLDQLLASGVAVISFIGNQSFGRSFEFSSVQLLQGRLQQSHFRRGRRVHVNSERSTLAICQNHKLCSLAALGFPDRSAPFFATTKVPSMKHSSHRTMPCSSNWVKNARHKLSKVSLSDHSPKRRCTVLGLPYRSGSSLHGDPVQRIQRIPSKQSLSLARGRPPFDLSGCAGKCGSIAAHCCVVNCFQAMISHLMPEFINSHQKCTVLG
jgi:hypothetical protein